jgi:hypothetical protein
MRQFFAAHHRRPGHGAPLVAAPNVPRKVQDARAAFDNLFKKTSE